LEEFELHGIHLVGARGDRAEKEGEKDASDHGEKDEAASKRELSVIVNPMPTQAAEGAVDALHEFAVLLAFRMLDGRRGAQAAV
jgi:hypothetical protein